MYLMFPVAIAVNISYLLPVSTPCNAIVYAYGDIRVSDMVICMASYFTVCISNAFTDRWVLNVLKYLGYYFIISR